MLTAFGAEAAEPLAAPAESSGAGRFVAAHGERAVVMGYPDSGLEIWAYPLQILAGLKLGIHEAGRVAVFDAAVLPTRLEYGPNEVVRVYVGPDFVVREHLFTPEHAPGAILRYEVEGRPDVRLEVRFQPSLDLMWPGALGGQTTEWSDALEGFVEREPLHHFSAVIRSPQAVEHDSTVNRTSGREGGLALVLRPGGPAAGRRMASLYVAADPTGSGDAARLAADLETNEAALRGEAAAHQQALLSDAIQINTPDPKLNRALQASILALDQAWACQPAIGCGEVAGYGPSRPGRRPQYAWFFAGDGMVAVEGLLAAGEYARASEELAFISQFQNRTTGMIWHEISMSAPLIDWANRYPYMFVHVDITGQYLVTLADYATVTGDTAWVARRWAGVQAAWRYARSLVDPADGLPSIPAGKEGENEQDALRDDAKLSSEWIDAADAFGRLARATGHARDAAEAERAAAVARRAIAAHGWDAAQGFWAAGHAASGEPVKDETLAANRLLLQGVFSPAQVGHALDRLSSPAFQADWGTRSLPADSPDYDPNAYAKGSVWGLGASALATSLWRAHRPLAAWGAWRGLIGWSDIDSLGHMPEVLAGDLYHPEIESVPEQTWSSAGFLTSAMGGLLGLEVRSGERRLVFAPTLPGDWEEVNLANVHVGDARLRLALKRDDHATRLEIENHGGPVAGEFAPDVPLGARLTGAEVDGVASAPMLEPWPGDPHARLTLSAKPGVTNVTIHYAGGVRVAPLPSALRLGDHSGELKVVSAVWADGALVIRAHVLDPERAAVDLITQLTPTDARGGRLFRVAPCRYRLTLDPGANPATSVEVRVSFAPTT